MDNCFQILNLEEQKRLSLTCVVAVDGFTDEKIRLKVKTGGLVITGEKLKINNFSETTGAFLCEGVIRGVNFTEKKENFVKRLFK